MQPVIEQLPEGARVLLIRLRSLGDCVLTTPALALLKRFRPDLETGVVVERRFAPVFEGNPDVDVILEPRMGTVARWGAALAVNFHGGTRSIALTLASRARRRAGFGHYRFSGVYNVRIPRAQEILGEERTVHTAEHLASAMFYLGVPHTEIPRAKLFPGPPPMDAPYAVLHPAASAPDKTWPAARFAELARRLRGEWGLEPVFIGAASDDLEPFREFRRFAGEPLGRVISLIAGAELFAGNDSGPAHIAAACGVPLAVLFGPSNPAIWGPWKTPAAVFHSPEGLERVRVEEVFEGLARLRRELRPGGSVSEPEHARRPAP